jgi:hypothetical protein
MTRRDGTLLCSSVCAQKLAEAKHLTSTAGQQRNPPSLTSSQRNSSQSSMSPAANSLQRTLSPATNGQPRTMSPVGQQRIMSPVTNGQPRTMSPAGQPRTMSPATNIQSPIISNGQQVASSQILGSRSGSGNDRLTSSQPPPPYRPKNQAVSKGISKAAIPPPTGPKPGSHHPAGTTLLPPYQPLLHVQQHQNGRSSGSGRHVQFAGTFQPDQSSDGYSSSHSTPPFHSRESSYSTIV